MHNQLISPVADSLALSFLVAAAPVATVLALLGIFRRPAWQASIIGTLVAIILAVGVWELPFSLTVSSLAAGATFAAWPVMWIVFNALLLYNISVSSGRFDAFRRWMIKHLPNDKRVVLVVVGFAFGSLLEGVAGFGAPIAITSALLVALGFKAIDAVVYSLMFNTAPVAFGALGTPVTTLGAVTQLDDVTLGAMIGRQLPLLAFLLPFYVIAVFGGLRSLRGVWPVLAVAGGSFALTQFASSNFLSYALTDVLSALAALGATLLFVKMWRIPVDPRYAVASDVSAVEDPSPARQISGWEGWLPWIILSVTVVVWVHFGVSSIGEVQLEWPGLHEQVFITAYSRPYAAIWTFQPLTTGTAILFATCLTALAVRLSPDQAWQALSQTCKQIRLPMATTMVIIGLAYLMNYSGITYTLGLGIASTGVLFPLVSAFLGWLAVFLSGSDTAGNALFGNLQVVAARRLELSPILMAATNASGGVLGKMISPQNIATGTATTDCRGQEGDILARTFKHSVFLTLLLSVVVLIQQYVFPGIIPS